MHALREPRPETSTCSARMSTHPARQREKIAPIFVPNLLGALNFPHGKKKAVQPKTHEAAAPATPPRALVATLCPPSSGKRGPPGSRSSASPGSWTSSGGHRSWSSSGGRTPPHLDADGFQLVLVVGRMGKGRSGAKVPKKARERERDGSL